MKPPPTIHDEMMHLLTGNRHGLSALLLRKRIARDTDLQSEWKAMQAVADALRQPTPVPYNAAPRWPAPKTPDVSAFTLRKRTLKRGVAAVTVLTLTTVGGVTLYRVFGATTYWSQDGRWVVRSRSGGEFRIYDAAGANLAQCVFGGAPSPLIQGQVTLDGKEFTVFGPGIQALRTPDGQVVGFAETVHPGDRQDVGSPQDSISLYNSDTYAAKEVPHAQFMSGAPGIVVSVDRSRGVAWKLLGYGGVEVKRFGGSPPFREPLVSTPPYLAPRDIQDRFWRQKRIAELFPAADVTPRLQWSLASPNLDGQKGLYLFRNGRWFKPWRSGTFTGYGQHTVRDERGKPILNFDVKPPPPKATTPVASPPPAR